MGSVVVIINPISGPTRRGSPSERVQLAKRAFDTLGMSGEIRLTERPRHAYEMAQEAVRAGASLVIAWGGDGTINEVGRALAHTATALGIIPGGSGNGLSRALKIPFDPSVAFQKVLCGRDAVMDAGDMDGRMFFNIAGIGLDAHVARSVATKINHRGFIPYLAASTRDLLNFRPAAYSIETETGTFEATALIVAIANSTQYGFGAAIAPQALIDDGVLDLIVVEDRRFFGNVARLPSVFLGGFDRQAGVHVSKVRHVRIRSDARMLMHVDGEATEGGTDLLTRVHPGALRIRV